MIEEELAYSLEDRYRRQNVCEDPVHRVHLFRSRSLAKDSDECHQQLEEIFW